MWQMAVTPWFRPADLGTLHCPALQEVPSCVFTHNLCVCPHLCLSFPYSAAAQDTWLYQAVCPSFDSMQCAPHAMIKSMEVCLCVWHSSVPLAHALINPKLPSGSRSRSSCRKGQDCRTRKRRHRFWSHKSWRQKKKDKCTMFIFQS